AARATTRRPGTRSASGRLRRELVRPAPPLPGKAGYAVSRRLRRLHLDPAAGHRRQAELAFAFLHIPVPVPPLPCPRVLLEAEDGRAVRQPADQLGWVLLARPNGVSRAVGPHEVHGRAPLHEERAIALQLGAVRDREHAHLIQHGADLTPD